MVLSFININKDSGMIFVFYFYILREKIVRENRCVLMLYAWSDRLMVAQDSFRDQFMMAAAIKT